MCGRRAKENGRKISNERSIKGVDEWGKREVRGRGENKKEKEYEMMEKQQDAGDEDGVEEQR